MELSELLILRCQGKIWYTQFWRTVSSYFKVPQILFHIIYSSLEPHLSILLPKPFPILYGSSAIIKSTLLFFIFFITSRESPRIMVDKLSSVYSNEPETKSLYIILTSNTKLLLSNYIMESYE